MAINMGAKDNSMLQKSISDNNEFAVSEYNIQEDVDKFVQNLQGSQVIEDLTALIDIGNPETIVTFGNEVATELSKTSDTVLNNMSIDKINESSQMLEILGNIMDQFNIDEIQATENQNLFSKFLNNGQKKLEQILNKYNTIGSEVDKVYIQLKEYEKEIHESNKNLEKIFQSNVNFYHNLLEYIVAGEQGVKEIEDYIAQRRAEFEKTGDTSIHFEIANLEQASQMLAQRTLDLRIAENVALQSIPMLKTMQFSNLNLIRKINSAFIITLPIFKQSLAQAIMLKRQKIQSEAMSALDKKTNEMLLKNAQNTVEQAKLISKLASSSSIKVDTLEQTWQIIKDGIEETKQIQKEVLSERQSDIKRLSTIKEDLKNSFVK
ncbi:hypothetical protein AN641_08555 [Candidatus Epulonipiscioides gigas]|nr:hypothetical protein AN641_08555 [Epulopiscium sp. SCG-C07WGA-EpuloA2]